MQELTAKEAPNAAVETIVVDVAQPESVTAIAACTVAHWGRIDYQLISICLASLFSLL